MTQAATTSTTTAPRPRAGRKKFWTARRLTGAVVLLPFVIVAALYFLPTTRWIYCTGYIMTDQEVELRPSVEGAVKQWLVSNGELVSKDQVLIQLGDSVQRAAHEQAIAELQAREASMQQLLSAQTLDKAQRLEQEYQAKQSLALAKSNLERLSKGGAYSPNEVQDRQLRVELAASRLKELRIPRDNVMDHQLQVLREQINSAKKNVALQEAELAMRQVRAPMAGRVYFNRFEPGEVVKPEHVLGQVFDRDTWVAKLKVGERSIGYLEENQVVEVALAAYPKIRHGTLAARVTRIWPIVTPGATGDGFFYVEAVIDMPGRFSLQPGMSASAYVGAGRTNWLYRLIGW